MIGSSYWQVDCSGPRNQHKCWTIQKYVFVFIELLMTYYVENLANRGLAYLAFTLEMNVKHGSSSCVILFFNQGLFLI